MGAISDELSNPKDKNAAASLEFAISRANWLGHANCVIDVEVAKYLLAVLVEKEKNNA